MGEGTGIGVSSVRERLRVLYGDAASVDAGPRARGFGVTLRLPARTGGRGAGGMSGTDPLRALVVEDEPLARAPPPGSARAGARRLRWVGEAATVSAAHRGAGPAPAGPRLPRRAARGWLGARRPPGGGARDGVIFTTAHDRFAVTAFELGALDYLLKPFGAERFARALERARRAARAPRQRRRSGGARSSVRIGCSGSSSGTAGASFPWR